MMTEGLRQGGFLGLALTSRLFFYPLRIEDDVKELSLPGGKPGYRIFLAMLFLPVTAYIIFSFLLYILLYLLLWIPFGIFSLCDWLDFKGVRPFRLWRRSLVTSLFFPIAAPGFYLFDFGVMFLLAILALAFEMSLRVTNFVTKSSRVIWSSLVRSIDSIWKLFAL